MQLCGPRRAATIGVIQMSPLRSSGRRELERESTRAPPARVAPLPGKASARHRRQQALPTRPIRVSRCCLFRRGWLLLRHEAPVSTRRLRLLDCPCGPASSGRQPAPRRYRAAAQPVNRHPWPAPSCPPPPPPTRRPRVRFIRTRALTRRGTRSYETPYLCRDPASSAGSGVVGGELLVGVGGACARSRRCALCARAPSLTSVHDPRVGSGAGDMMFDGVIPLGEALRPLGLSGPSTRAWRQESAGSRPRRIWLTKGCARTGKVMRVPVPPGRARVACGMSA
jgi:hypothetical protein